MAATYFIGYLKSEEFLYFLLGSLFLGVIGYLAQCTLDEIRFRSIKEDPDLVDEIKRYGLVTFVRSESVEDIITTGLETTTFFLNVEDETVQKEMQDFISEYGFDAAVVVNELTDGQLKALKYQRGNAIFEYDGDILRDEMDIYLL